MRLATRLLGGGGPDLEDRLRTYMLNGTTPDELEAVVEANRAAYDERQKRSAHPAGL